MKQFFTEFQQLAITYAESSHRFLSFETTFYFQVSAIFYGCCDIEHHLICYRAVLKVRLPLGGSSKDSKVFITLWRTVFL